MKKTISFDARPVRIKALSPAIVYPADESFYLPCVIRDVSAAGAKSYGKNLEFLPDNILLKLECLETKVEALIIWCDRKCVGVKIDWEKTLLNS